MNKIIFLLLCWTFTTTFAEIPSWYPENIEEIAKKCVEETQLPYSIQQDLKRAPVDNPKAHKFMLCLVKSTNVYSEENGLNVDRLTYSYYRSQSKINSRKPLVQDCADKNREVASDAEMIFKVINCIFDKEDEMRKITDKKSS